MDPKLPESRERQIFHDLMTCRLNDAGVPRQAQSDVAVRHGISVDEVRAIERKGMARDWPPLD
jgi:hypothetical protein